MGAATDMAVTASSQTLAGDQGGMDYLQSVPRRLVTIYLPLCIFVFVLLFPFYWMAVTAIKPNNEMTSYDRFSPFWVAEPRSSTSITCCSRRRIRAGC